MDPFLSLSAQQGPVGEVAGSSFRRPKAAKIDPKCDHKRTKIEDKNEDENKTFFKIVLKRSWSHLGPILGPSDLCLACLKVSQNKMAFQLTPSKAHVFFSKPHMVNQGGVP